MAFGKAAADILATRQSEDRPPSTATSSQCLCSLLAHPGSQSSAHRKYVREKAMHSSDSPDGGSVSVLLTPKSKQLKEDRK